jgi:SAM-dependent methyltransferase
VNTRDLFSGHSKLYAAFRPTYPEELYAFLFSLVRSKGVAWDCATGNGQVARRLAQAFEKVYATDISAEQLAEAHPHPKIVYSVGNAEAPAFEANTFDLVTVGQALHWFDTESFFREVQRVTRPGGIIAVWGYTNLRVDPEVDTLVSEFYHSVVGPFWNDARTLVEQEYRTIAFPFRQVPAPPFSIREQWTLRHLAGYLESWSATQAYIRHNKSNPVPSVISAINGVWRNDEIKTVIFPVFLKVGIIN